MLKRGSCCLSVLESIASNFLLSLFKAFKSDAKLKILNILYAKKYFLTLLIFSD